MPHRDFYKPTDSKQEDNLQPKRINSISILFIILIALQAGISAASAPTGVEMMRLGGISPIHFLSFALSTVSLFLSALFLLLRRTASRYVACFSLIFVIFPIFQWQPTLYISQAIIAILAIALSFRQSASNKN